VICLCQYPQKSTDGLAGETAVSPIFFVVRGLDVAAEISAVDFRDLTLTAKRAAFHFFGDGLAQFVQQDVSAFIGHAQIARHGQHRLSLNQKIARADPGKADAVTVREILTLRTAKMFRTKQTDAERREKNRLR
jgi:hypothetical protein